MECGWCRKKLTCDNAGFVDVTYCLECDGGKILSENDFAMFGDDNDKYFDVEVDIKLAILMDDHLSMKRLPTKEEVQLYTKYKKKNENY
jgi:hypothetical protein